MKVLRSVALVAACAALPICAAAQTATAGQTKKIPPGQMKKNILKMSDALSDGIVKQFPEKFGAAPTATTGRR